MSRGNPSVERAVSVLTVFGAEPERGFTLAEIVRQTDLSKATCHALLASLVDAHWLLRHPSGPSYRLGPGLIALGEAARRGYPELPYAQDRMAALAHELGLECLASAVAGTEIVILARSGIPAPIGTSVAVGQRIPLAPPLATVFFAWSPESAIAAAFGSWTGTTDALNESYRRGLRAVRERGFAVGLENPVRERLGRTYAMQLSRGKLSPPEVTQLLSALADEDYQLVDEQEGPPGARYWLSFLAAPVFDATAKVALAITMVGFSSALDADEIFRLGGRLRAAADDVTAAVHGRVPASLEEAFG